MSIEPIIERLQRDLQRLEDGPCKQCEGFESEVRSFEVTGEEDEKDRLILMLRGQLAQAQEESEDRRFRIMKLEEEADLADDAYTSLFERNDDLEDDMRTLRAEENERHAERLRKSMICGFKNCKCLCHAQEA